MTRRRTERPDVVGLLPCGGHATRLAPLPCSKELLPVGLRRTADGSVRPKVVSHYLLDLLFRAGIRRTIFILRKGKWDVADYYLDGSLVGMDVAYVLTQRPYGPPYTLDQAYPYVRGSRIALGFPDILLEPADAYARCLERLDTTRADIVLGVYRMRVTRTSDMVAIDRTGRVTDMQLKPSRTTLTLGWMFAVWAPTFTEFMHEYLSVPRTAAQGVPGLPEELTVGHVIHAAVREGLVAQSVVFHRRTYLDVGTPEGLTTLAGTEWRARLTEGIAPA